MKISSALRLAATATATATCLVAVAQPAFAQTRTFDIPAQDATTGIQILGIQTGLQIIGDERDLRNVRISAVRGKMSPREAVRRALAGTPLRIASDDGKILVVKRLTVGNAETGEEPDFASNSSDIVVTAQKSAQRISDVPMTVSAASGKHMQEIGVARLGDLSAYIPGLTIQQQSSNSVGIVIRGISSDSGSSQQSPRVTLYYNGIDISRARSSYQQAYDLERVEVIKGPQATLFGTASAVGTISLISALPKPNFSGELSAEYGNFNQTLLGGFVNAGSDVVAGRLAFQWMKRDGYVTNLAPNQAPHLNGLDQLGLRGSLRVTPADNLTVDLVGTYERQHDGAVSFISGTFATEAGPADPFGRAHLGGSPVSGDVLGRDTIGITRRVYDLNLSVNWDLGDDWTLTTVNGYRDFDALSVFDADGSAAWFLEFGETSKGWQASHETRFSYRSDTFRGFFGWNLFKESGYQEFRISTEEGTFLQCATRIVPGLGCVAADGSVPASQATATLTRGTATVLPYAMSTRNIGKNESYSVFADATWLPTPRLEVSAGVRALIEKRRSGYSARVPNAVLTGKPLPLGGVNTAGQTFYDEDSFEAFLPRFNVLYRISPALNAYATVSKGQRSTIVQMSAQSTSSGPAGRVSLIPKETVWNYEMGLKGGTDTLSGSLAVFYQVYDDFQVSVLQSSGVIQTVSAGSAKNLGAEADLSYHPATWLRLFGNIGYIDGKIDDKASNGRYAGNHFRLQPRFQGSAGLTIDAPISDGTSLFLTPSVTYRSKVYFDIPNNELLSQKPVALVNARAGVRFMEGRYELSMLVRNITDVNRLIDAGNSGAAFGYPTFIPAEPRFYSVQAKARF